MEKAYLITETTDIDSLNINLYDRFYFGDAYCEHNLIYFLENKTLIKKIFSLGKPLTLTTPIISEKNIKKLDSFIKNNTFPKGFEIVVNDMGVLSLLKNNYPNIQLIWGNFIAGQNKDPFLKVFKDKDTHKKITIDNAFYKKFISKNNIQYIELYNVFQGINITEKFDFTLYYPYVVYSINRYCPTKLVFDKKDYLSVVEDCDGCLGKNPSNLEMHLKMKTEVSNNFLRGNKQFYENNELIESSQIKRIIYNYDLKG